MHTDLQEGAEELQVQSPCLQGLVEHLQQTTLSLLQQQLHQNMANTAIQHVH